MPRVGVRFNKIAIGLDELSNDDFVHYVHRHLGNVRYTKKVEHYGKELIESNFDPDELKRFILAVCDWGGGARYGLGDKVIAGNRSEGLQEIFAEVVGFLENQPPQLDLAVEEISKVNGLSISFGSKHLRFLRPDICSVLDSVVSDNLGYNLNIFGYESYSLDCSKLAKYLEDAEVENPMERNGQWFAADIDMGVFAFL